jgi:hypothetical protein
MIGVNTHYNFPMDDTSINNIFYIELALGSLNIYDAKAEGLISVLSDR